jgi:hypothetical protein
VPSPPAGSDPRGAAGHAGNAARPQPAFDLAALGPQLRPGRPDVQRCFTLGWHIAELYGLPQETPAGEDSGTANSGREGGAPIDDTRSAGSQVGYLEVPKNLGRGILEKLIRIQIMADLALVPGIGPERGKQLLDAVPPLQSSDFRPAVRAMDEQILALLTGADFRLEKAYSIGRALYPISIQTDFEDLRRVAWDGGLFPAAVGWLRDLKTEFASCAADAVVGTLLQWQESVVPGTATSGRGKAGNTPSGKVPDGLLQRQGEIWRSLLSGEKMVTDYLNLGDYLVAGQHLMRQYARLARSVFGRGTWIVVGLIVAALAVGVCAAIYLRQDAAVIGIAGAALGFFGITSASIGMAVRQALTLVQRPLWEAEITDALLISTSTAQLAPADRRAVIDNSWRRPKYPDLRRP